MRGQEKGVQGAATSTDCKIIVSGSNDGTVCCWDARTRVTIGEPMRVYVEGILSVLNSRDGALIVSGSSNGTIRRWDSRSGASVDMPNYRHLGPVIDLAVSE